MTTQILMLMTLWQCVFINIQPLTLRLDYFCRILLNEFLDLCYKCFKFLLGK